MEVFRQEEATTLAKCKSLCDAADKCESFVHTKDHSHCIGFLSDCSERDDDLDANAYTCSYEGGGCGVAGETGLMCDGGPACAMYYNGIGGTQVSLLTEHASFPDSPSRTDSLDATGFFQTQTSYGNSYGAMLEGWVKAPETGACNAGVSLIGPRTNARGGWWCV